MRPYPVSLSTVKMLLFTTSYMFLHNHAITTGHQLNFIHQWLEVHHTICIQKYVFKIVYEHQIKYAIAKEKILLILAATKEVETRFYHQDLPRLFHNRSLLWKSPESQLINIHKIHLLYVNQLWRNNKMYLLSEVTICSWRD